MKKINADKEGTNEKDTLLKDPHSKISATKETIKSLGPGLITGASDDDPSGIATFSQAGAQFGFGMLWMALFQYPMMTVIQEMCARLGLVTGSGLGGILKKRYSKKILIPLSGLVLIANTINIGADIAAMGASVRLLVPEVPVLVTTIIFVVLIISLEILIPYRKYMKILKYLALFLLSYIITAIIVGGSWSQILTFSIISHVEIKPEFAVMFVTIIGTSISAIFILLAGFGRS